MIEKPANNKVVRRAVDAPSGVLRLHARLAVLVDLDDGVVNRRVLHLVVGEPVEDMGMFGTQVASIGADGVISCGAFGLFWVKRG